MSNYCVISLKKLLTLSLLSFLVSCSKLDIERPINSAPNINISPEASHINIPLTYALSELQGLINNQLKTELYKDDSFENNNNDKLKLTIKKREDISLWMTGDIMYYSLPLDIKVEKQIIGTKKLFNKKIFQKGHRFNFSVLVKLKSKIELEEDWQLKTTTDLISIDWGKNSMDKIADIGFIKKMITKQMDKALAKIDRTIHDKLDIKSKIQKVWTDIQKPILVNKKVNKVFLKIDPFEVFASKLNTHGNHLVLYLQLGIYMKTLTGNVKGYDVNKVLPNLKPLKTKSDEFEINILSQLSYEELNKTMKEALKGKKIDIEGNIVKVKKAEIYGSGEELVIALSIGGAVKSDLYLRGKPSYNAETNTVRLDSFNYDMQTEEILLSAANWLLEDEFKEFVQEQLHFSLDQPVEKLPSLIHKGISKGKIGKKIDLSIENIELYPKEILVSAKSLQLLINAKGNVALQLKKL